MNYIAIINNFWSNVPFLDGFKSHHTSLYFAILNQVNKNNWNKTKIDLGQILCLSGLSKPTYIEARRWLVDNKLIQITEGKNLYQMAEFSIIFNKVEGSVEDGIEDNIFTSTNTSTTPSTSTSTLPIYNKQVNNKHINNSTVVPTVENEPKKSKVFVPPTLEEVKQFFIEKTGVNGKASEEFALKFHSHYELNNWTYGRTKTKMQKWKLAVAQWDLQEYINKYPQQTQTTQTRNWSNNDKVYH